MNRLLLAVTVAVVALLSVPAPAHAQTAQSNPAPLVPRGDVFLGVAFFEQEGTSLCGFHLTGTWRAGAHVGVVGDVAVYGDHASYMNSVRVQSPGRHTLFVQLLAGKAPFSFFAIQPGIGFDSRVSRRVAVRTSADVKFSGDDSKTFIGTRLSVGLVILLGQQ
jgi:hypothetical protein